MISRLCFSSPMRGFGMISHMCFILAYESLWNDFSYVFDLHFFHLSNLPGPLNNGLKYLRFSRVIQILVSKKLTPRGMLPEGVNKDFLQKYKM